MPYPVSQFSFFLASLLVVIAIAFRLELVQSMVHNAIFSRSVQFAAFRSLQYWYDSHEDTVPKIPLVNEDDHRKFINPAWANNSSFIEAAAEELRAGKYIHIENAFTESFARAVQKEMLENLNYFRKFGNIASILGPLHSEFVYYLNKSTNEDRRCYLDLNKRQGFRYHHHNIYNDYPIPRKLKDIRDVAKNVLEGEGASLRAIIDRAFGSRPSLLRFNPSHYRPGDFSSPHSDKHYEREIAVIWHLTNSSDKDFYGGGLVWCNPFHKLAPKFNTLTVFLVTECSWHYVEPVFAESDSRKRLAVNGWFENNIIDTTLMKKYPSLLKKYRHYTDIPEPEGACARTSESIVPHSLVGGTRYNFVKNP